MFQDEYRDLLDGDRVGRVADASYGVLEFLDSYRFDDRIDFNEGSRENGGIVGDGRTSITYHGHCNQKAVGTDHHAVGVLRRAGYEVDPIDSGCCGMAGSFGYEAEHYDLSMAIGRILFDQIAESDGDVVTAPGSSCRTQLSERDGTEHPPHPVEMVERVMETGTGTTDG